MARKGFRLPLVGICVLCAQATFAQQYTVTELGTLGGHYSEAIAINGASQVLGNSPGSDLHTHPFIWTRGTMEDLGLLPGYTDCFAKAINDDGQVVGMCIKAVRDRDQAFLWAARTGMTALAIPTTHEVGGINAQGHIAGYHDCGETACRAFLYRNGVFEDLGEASAVTGINDQDQVVGVNGFRPMLWDEVGPHDLGTLEGPEGYGFGMAKAISAAGLPVGWSSTGTAENHAVLWTAYGLSNLGTLGSGSSAAEAISGDLIVGQSNTPSVSHAILYDNNGPGYPVDLNDLIPAGSGWVLWVARGINAGGQIVGFGMLNGVGRGFLLTPVQPPPAPH
jgi:probable HAF family extracellular repeat protein